ncbi:MAG TPA: outer membrane protein assembly factor BamA [Thermoanaerobaculia bacterium]|nr:outer membrane protein assembly factor BamA [Thermoanaerobaculia bacterium]
MKLDDTRCAPPASRRAPATRLLAWALAAALLLPAPAALAQQAPAGSRIDEIQFQGLRALSEETLLYYLGLERGQALDAARLDQNVKALWDRNLIDDIQVDTEPTAQGGVRLTITIVERATVRSVDYQGMKRISRNDLIDQIAAKGIRLREGDPLNLGELYRVKAMIEEAYAEKGYRFADATYAIEELTPTEKRVVFTVDEGDRVRIADIGFAGNRVFSATRLRLLMRKTNESGLFSRITKKDIYNPANLQEDLDKVRDLYRGAGYKNVVIGEPKIEIRAGGQTVPEEPQGGSQAPAAKRRMFITVPIEEGERWKFGEISIEGNEIYTDQALLRAFEQRPGSWLRAKAIDDGVKAVTETYHNTGYIFARIEPELVEKPGNVADLVVRIREGEQFHVGRIEFEGNDRTMDKVLRRELRLIEGGVMNIGAVRNSIYKINQLGYFELDKEEPVEFDQNTEAKKVHLLFKGTEKERTELQFGGGWSELDGFFGQFAINTKNFLGRGEQVGVAFQSGRFRNYFDLSYYVPWFLDRPQSIGIRAFDQELDFRVAAQQEFRRKSTGGVLTYGRQLGLFQQGSVSYNRSVLEDETEILFDETGNPIPEPEALRFREIDNSSLRPAYSYDSRDNPFEPTRGRRLTLGVEYAGGFLGGDNYFVRPEASFSIFQPIGRAPVATVLAFNVEGGLVDPFGGRELSSLERFFLGGDNSIRGHRFRSIVLRDDQGRILLDEGGFALGGDSFVQLNLEYHFLLGGPFRLLIFADGGNVFGEGDSLDVSNLRTTAGAELRVLVPVFGAPLRFIYATNLDPLPGDRFEAFQFSVGTSF